MVTAPNPGGPVRSQSGPRARPPRPAAVSRAALATLLVLGGCGLGEVGPEADKLAAWKAQQADAHDDAEGDVTQGDVTQGDVTPADTAPDTGAGDASGDDANDSGGADAGCSAASDCDDGDVCTADSCVAATGVCAHEPKSGPCDDGDPCTSGDTCAKGTCAGTAKDCADDNPCTLDLCNAGSCGHTAVKGGACDDGDACTLAACPLDGSSPVCTKTGEVDCDDGNACTQDTCDPKSGCTHTSLTTPCDLGDACALGACKTVAGKAACVKTGPKTCDDGDVCTDDTCKPGVGCVTVPNAAPCDDGVACTVADVCTSGTCSGKAALFDSGWSGPKFASVQGALPLSDGGFLAVGAEAPTSGKPAGRLWTFSAGDPLPLAWQVTLTGVGIFDVVELPGEATFALGMHYDGRFDSWVAPINPAKQSVGTAATLGADGEIHIWRRGAALPGSGGAAGSVALVGVRIDKAGVTHGRVARLDATGKWAAQPPAEVTHVELRAAAATPGVSGDVSACGQWSEGLAAAPVSGPRAWFARVDVAGKLHVSRPFGWRGAHCAGLTGLPQGGLVAVGHVQAEASGPRVAMAWRVTPAGAVTARWRSPSGGDDALTGVVSAGGSALFAVGERTAVAGTKAGLTLRWQPDFSAAQVESYPGAAPRAFAAAAWHPAGYLVAVGSSEPAGQGERPWAAAVDPWGHTSCKAAGACASVSLHTCGTGDPCTVPGCSAQAGCTLTPRAGSCDDGAPCTAGARCAQGVCKAGTPRLHEAAVTVPAPADKAGFVATVALPEDDVALAYTETAKGGSSLNLSGRSPAGAALWTQTLALGGDTPTGLVRSGDVLWSHGETSAGGGWVWPVSVTGAAQAKGPGTSTLSWQCAAAAPAGELHVAHVSSTGTVSVARWATTGASGVPKAVAFQESGAASVPAQRLSRCDALITTDQGWVLAGAGAAGTPSWARLDAKGAVIAWQPTASGADVTQLDYVADWGRPAGVFARANGLRGLLSVAAYPAPAQAQSSWKAAATPRLAVFDAGGHVRGVSRPFNPKPDRVLTAVQLPDGGVALLTATTFGKATELAVALANEAGSVHTTWTRTVPDLVQMAAAATVTTDGALLVAARGVDQDTGKPTMRLLRTTVWGHTSCAKAGACANVSASACDTGVACTPGRCDTTTGCKPAQTATCLPSAQCVAGGACSGAACVATGSPTGKGALSCDDQSPCTADACSASAGCTHAPLSDVACSDGDLCTLQDTCKSGVCVATPNACDDKVACTVDSCVAATGACKHVTDDSHCKDGNSCTSDSCDAKQGCTFKPVAIGASCGQGLVCTGSVCHAPWAESLSLGHGFACALDAKGVVRCWGKGDKGQLGDGGDSTKDDPQVVKLPAAAVQVSAGAKHACAVTVGGQVVCWGDNSQGQRGPGSVGKGPEVVKNISAATAVAAGVHHSCAVVQGALWCWGTSNAGETGVGPQGGQGLQKVQAGAADFTQVVVGTEHTCALRKGGGVACLGDHTYKQLGDANFKGLSSTQAVTVMSAPGKPLAEVAGLTAGPRCTWALHGPAAKAAGWGGDRFGAGLEDGVAESSAVGTPADYVGSGFAAVAAAVDHTCVLVAQGGTVLCTGASKDKTLGAGGAAPVSQPTTVPGVSGLIGLAAGPSVTCGLRSDGAVVCWGLDVDGAAQSAALVPGSAPDQP